MCLTIWATQVGSVPCSGLNRPNSKGPELGATPQIPHPQANEPRHISYQTPTTPPKAVRAEILPVSTLSAMFGFSRAFQTALRQSPISFQLGTARVLNHSNLLSFLLFDKHKQSQLPVTGMSHCSLILFDHANCSHDDFSAGTSHRATCTPFP